MSTTTKSTMEFSGDADKLTQAIRQIVDTNKQLIQSIDQLSRKSQDANDRAIEAARKRDDEAQKRKTQLDEEKRLKEAQKTIDQALGDARAKIAAKEKSDTEELMRLQRSFNEQLNTHRKLRAADDKVAQDKYTEGLRKTFRIWQHVKENEVQETKKANDKITAMHAMQLMEVENILGSELAMRRRILKRQNDDAMVAGLLAVGEEAKFQKVKQSWIKQTHDMQQQMRKMDESNEKSSMASKLAMYAAQYLAVSKLVGVSTQLVQLDEQRLQTNRQIATEFDKGARKAMIQAMMSSDQFKDVMNNELMPIANQFRVPIDDVVQQFREIANAGVDPKQVASVAKETIALQLATGGDDDPVFFTRGVMQMLAAMRGGGQNIRPEDVKRIASPFAGLFRGQPVQPGDIAEVSKIAGMATNFGQSMEDVFAPFAALRGGGGKPPEEAQVAIRNLMVAAQAINKPGALRDAIREAAKQKGEDPEQVLKKFNLRESRFPEMIAAVGQWMNDIDPQSRDVLMTMLAEDRGMPGVSYLMSPSGTKAINAALKDMDPKMGADVMRKNIGTKTTGRAAEQNLLNNLKKKAQVEAEQREGAMNTFQELMLIKAAQNQDWLASTIQTFGWSGIPGWFAKRGVAAAVERAGGPDALGIINNQILAGMAGKREDWQPPAGVAGPKPVRNIVANPNPRKIDLDLRAKQQQQFEFNINELDRNIERFRIQKESVEFEIREMDARFREKHPVGKKPFEQTEQERQMRRIADGVERQIDILQQQKHEQIIQRQAHEAR